MRACKIAWLHTPGQWGHTGMHCRREGGGVDVVLQNDHLHAYAAASTVCSGHIRIILLHDIAKHQGGFSGMHVANWNVETQGQCSELPAPCKRDLISGMPRAEQCSAVWQVRWGADSAWCSGGNATPLASSSEWKGITSRGQVSYGCCASMVSCARRSRQISE